MAPGKFGGWCQCEQQMAGTCWLAPAPRLAANTHAVFLVNSSSYKLGEVPRCFIRASRLVVSSWQLFCILPVFVRLHPLALKLRPFTAHPIDRSTHDLNDAWLRF